MRPRDDPAHYRRAGDPSFTILQLLLGNIGKPGGGVNALRGEPNVQGASTSPCFTTTCRAISALLQTLTDDP